MTDCSPNKSFDGKIVVETHDDMIMDKDKFKANHNNSKMVVREYSIKSTGKDCTQICTMIKDKIFGFSIYKDCDTVVCGPNHKKIAAEVLEGTKESVNKKIYNNKFGGWLAQPYSVEDKKSI